MITNGRIALRGLSNLTLAPVVKNDDWEYEAGEQFALPGVMRMNVYQDFIHETIYADDQVYLNRSEYRRSRVKIILAELSLDMLVKLGFGSFDNEGDMFINPSGTGKEFCLSFACNANPRLKTIV